MSFKAFKFLRKTSIDQILAREKLYFVNLATWPSELGLVGHPEFGALLEHAKFYDFQQYYIIKELVF